MDLDELRFRLAQCDRALLEIQYCYDEALELHKMLLAQKSVVNIGVRLTSEIEHHLCLLDKEIMYANETVESARHGIEVCLNARVNVERLMNVNFGKY